jgi:hypothetical protein
MVMKKCMIFLMTAFLSLMVQSQEILQGGIHYYGNYMGAATIAAFQSKDLEGDIIIPSELKYQDESLAVTQIEQYAFSECTNIHSITIPSSIDETTYDYGYEFYGCASLERVTLSPNMQILKGTFMGCKALKNITIPEGVKYMDYVFENCSELDGITLPESLIEIGLECFYGCTSLRKIVIPSSVGSIGQDAFAYCRGLNSVTCLALVPPSCLGRRGPRWVDVNPFRNIAPNATLYVPNAVLESYKNSFPWNTFYKIEPYETVGISTVSDISQNGYSGCWNLSGQRIVIPKSGIFIRNGKKYLTHE